MGNSLLIRPESRRTGRKPDIYLAAGLLFAVVVLIFPLPEGLWIPSIFIVVAVFSLVFAFTGRTEKTDFHSVDELIATARASAEMERGPQSEKAYCQAIYRLLSSGDMRRSGELFEEYFLRFRKTFAPRLQLELCRELCVKGRYLIAARALEKVVEEWPVQYPHQDIRLLEQTYLQLARIYADKLRLPALAIDCYFALLERFPKSVYRETALYQLQVLDKEYDRTKGRW